MSDSTLPAGWFYADATAGDSLVAELVREMPPGHLLFGLKVEAVAFRQDQDDVLFHHLNVPDRYSVVHLTWRRKQEIDAKRPTVFFDGAYKDFVAREEKVHELE